MNNYNTFMKHSFTTSYIVSLQENYVNKVFGTSIENYLYIGIDENILKNLVSC